MTRLQSFCAISIPCLRLMVGIDARSCDHDRSGDRSGNADRLFATDRVGPWPDGQHKKVLSEDMALSLSHLSSPPGIGTAWTGHGDHIDPATPLPIVLPATPGTHHDIVC